MPLDPSTASGLKDALGTVVVIPVTPMRPDGSPEWGTYSDLIRRVVDAGITVITPNGNTGEFYALTEAEARQATEAAVKAAHGEVALGARAHVLVGVGHDTASAAAAARHAREAGAEMIMIHQPVHPYQAAEGWVDYHQAIADAVPDLGVVLYVRNERVTGAQIADLGERCPNVIGIKYGVKDATQFAAVARDAGLDRFTWLAGLAEPYAPGYWAYGARGFTSGLANVNPALSLSLLGALRAGDLTGAMDAWEDIRPFEDLRAAGGAADNVSVVKEALAQLGLCGRDVRPPSRVLPDTERAAVGAILRSWDPFAASETASGTASDRRPRDRRRERRRKGAPVTSTPEERAPEQLRSHAWFGSERMGGLRSFGHRSRMRQLGISAEEHLGKPIIAILNTWSEMNPCHMHLRERASQVKRGVLEAGGFPVEFPVATLSETFQKPTPMMYRNLLAMDTEELLRSYPADGAVLMGGCDKTTPALLMGAASAGIPAIYVPAGPMLRGNYRGQPVGSGTDVWKFWDDARAGLIGDCEMADLEGGIARSPGHCMTMGTASTMTSAAEALGMTLPGAASIPAVDSAHYRMAAASGQRIVQMVWDDLRPADILTREAFEDAAATVLALGGSTNALIHLIAMAGRAGVELTLDDFDEISRRVPVLANIRPSGTYLMEDFYYAGGLRAMLGQLAQVPGALHLSRRTVTGATFGEQITDVPVHDEDVIRSPEHALSAEGGVAVLRGNLAPDGAVIKHIAAEPRLLKHTGPAVVFDSYAEMQQRINDPALNVTPDSVLVLRNAGPKGGPGMPEYGMLPIPDYLLAQGVRDMVRISDARMSGTSYGACVLHVAPEAFVGGPLALVRTGDAITLDAAARELRLEVSERELADRRAQWQVPAPKFERGYGVLFTEQITQANEGCDFAFLARHGHNPDPNAQ